MLLLIETWSAACCWFSECTNCSMVRPDSDKLLFNPGERQARAGPGPASGARVPQQTRSPSAGSTAPCRRPPESGSSGLRGDLRHLVGPIDRRGFDSILSAAIRAATRRRFSIRARRSMMGMAHKLAQFQGSHRLVGGYETAEVFRIHPPISVRDRLQRDVIHPRKPGRWAVQQARQFPAVTPWAGVAWPFESVPRSNRSCRAAILPPGAIRRFALTSSVSRLWTSSRRLSFSASRARRRSRGRPNFSWCAPARTLPCCSI
jgi:hypothetical protein